MFASEAALFPLQRELFSCRNTHAFQQNLISSSYSLYSFCSFFLCFKNRFMQIFASCSLFSRSSAVRTLAQALNEHKPEFSGFHNGFKHNLDRKRFSFHGLIAAEVA